MPLTVGCFGKIQEKKAMQSKLKCIGPGAEICLAEEGLDERIYSFS